MPELQWYYACDEQQHGPVSSAELKQLASGGQLGPDDYVWREGMDEWAPASKVKGLFPDAPATIAPPPPEPEPLFAEPEADESEAAPTAPLARTRRARRSSRSLADTLSLVQNVLWGVCVLVVLLGVLLLTITFVRSRDPQQETAAGVLFAAIVLGAYILARAGEKISERLLAARPKGDELPP